MSTKSLGVLLKVEKKGEEGNKKARYGYTKTFSTNTQCVWL